MSLSPFSIFFLLLLLLLLPISHFVIPDFFIPGVLLWLLEGGKFSHFLISPFPPPPPPLPQQKKNNKKQ